MSEGGKDAVRVDDEVVVASPPRRTGARTGTAAEPQTMEVKLLKEALSRWSVT